jgi:hypothetical protein
MAGIYAADGSMNVTVVDGLTRTGVYAADGSRNVILAPGGTYVGAYHPCGAWWVTVSLGTLTSIRAPDGSLYVSDASTQGGISKNSGQPVTVVSGTLFGSNAFLLLDDNTSFLLLNDNTSKLILASN